MTATATNAPAPARPAGRAVQGAQTAPRPKARAVTGRDVIAGGLLAAALLAGGRYLDAERASDAGRAGSIIDLMLGHRAHHESPWDWSGPSGVTTCYGDTVGFGTPGEQCDTDPRRPGIQTPGPVPLTHLRPGAACPADVPQWATCGGRDPVP